MTDQRVKHLLVVDCVLQFLKASLRRLLLFKRGESLTMEAITNADYAG